MSPEEQVPSEAIQEPQNAEEYTRRGWYYHVKNDFAQSEKDFQQALSLDRDLVEAHYGLGMSYAVQEKEEDAIQQFEKTIELIEAGGLKQDSSRATMLRHLSQTHIEMIKKGEHLEKAP